MDPNRVAIRILLAAMIFLIIISAFNVALGAETEGKNRTDVYGYTSSEDSNFAFALRQSDEYRYLYPQLHLFLQTWENSSDYRIFVNGDEKLNGTIYEGTSKVDVELPTGSAVDITVEIGDDRYQYERKLVTDQSVESGWQGPEKEEKPHEFTDAEFTIFTWKTLGYGIIGAAAAVITMYPVSQFTGKSKTGDLSP